MSDQRDIGKELVDGLKEAVAIELLDKILNAVHYPGANKTVRLEAIREVIDQAEARGKRIAVETLEHDRCCPGGWKHLKRLLKGRHIHCKEDYMRDERWQGYWEATCDFRQMMNCGFTLEEIWSVLSQSSETNKFPQIPLNPQHVPRKKLKPLPIDPELIAQLPEEE